MKVVGITILRAGASLPDPIPLCMACDLSSYGFFQRQVSFSSHRSRGTDTENNLWYDSCAIMGGVAGEGGRERRQLFALMFYHNGVIISSSKLYVRRGSGGRFRVAKGIILVVITLHLIFFA